MPAPRRPEEADVVGQKELAAVLETARNAYEAIVIDTGPLFDAPMLAALDHTDQLLLICNPEVTSLKNVRIGLETIDRLGFDRERVSLVANRWAPGRLSRVGHRARARCTIAYELPDDSAVPAAVNRALPVVLARAAEQFSRALTSSRPTVFAGSGDEQEQLQRRSSAEADDETDRPQRLSRVSDASVLAERLQVDRGAVRARARTRTPS